MNKDLQHIDEIEQYLSGDLAPEAKNEFEQKLREDPNFREEVDLTSQLIEAIEGYAFKEMLKDIHKRNFKKDENI